MTKEEKRLRQNEAQKRWRLSHPEKVKELNKKNRSTPEAKERHRMKMIEWRKNNPQKVLEINRKNWKANGKKYNERARIKYSSDVDYKSKKLARDQKYNLSGKRKLIYHSDPNKKESLKKKWIRIKKGDYYGKVRKYAKKYREEVLIKKEKDDRDNLADSYVIMVIKKQQKYQLKTAEIPKELIEIKRNILKLKRITKNQKP